MSDKRVTKLRARVRQEMAAAAEQPKPTPVQQPPMGFSPLGVFGPDDKSVAYDTEHETNLLRRPRDPSYNPG